VANRIHIISTSKTLFCFLQTIQKLSKMGKIFTSNVDASSRQEKKVVFAKATYAVTFHY